MIYWSYMAKIKAAEFQAKDLAIQGANDGSMNSWQVKLRFGGLGV
jgi:hypothetical protein